MGTVLSQPQLAAQARSVVREQATRLDDGSRDRRKLLGELAQLERLTTLEALYREQVDEFRSGRSDAKKLIGIGDAPPDPALDPVECAAMTVLAQALLNFQDTVMND